VADTQQKVTVVVPVRDDAERLHKVLECLARQDYPLELLETIVVDSASDPPMRVSPPETLCVRTIRLDESGSYRARNAALAVSTSPVLAFTDADCLPDATWLTAAVRALGASADVVGGPIQVFARNPEHPHPAEAWEVVHGFPQHRYVRDGWAATANMVTTREVFDRVGYFDERLASGGDAEWGRRATAAGNRVVFVADAVVRHPARANFRELRTKLRRVHCGALERDIDASSVRWWRGLAPGLVPPLGSVVRGWQDPRFPRIRAKMSYSLGEFYVRYVGTALRTRLNYERARVSGRDDRTPA